MASIKAFNGMLYQFVEELSHAFPAEQQLQACVVKLPLLSDANPRKAMDLFLQALGPFAHKITARDESLFDEVPSLCGQVNLSALWAQADGDTRGAIWQYLQTLYFMASTVDALPPQLLSSIETVAESCAGKIDSGELDMSQLLSALPGVLNSIAAAQGGGDCF
jgi:hypothetical protein